MKAIGLRRGFPAFGQRLRLVAVFWALFSLAAQAADPDAPNGLFLVASPSLQDPNFRETVVLVTRHGRGATVGVIVNRPTEVTLKDVFADHEKLKNSTEVIFFGGPVSPYLPVFVFEAAAKPRDALPVLEGVYMSFDPKLLQDLLDHPQPGRRFRVYAGYAGWAPGQLEMEIERGDWYLMRAEKKVLFGMEPKDIWPELIKRATSHWVRTSAPRYAYSRR